MEPPGRPRGPGALRTFLSLAFGFLRVRSLPFEFLLSEKNATGRGRSYTKKGEQRYNQKSQRVQPTCHGIAGQDKNFIFCERDN